MTLPLIGSIFGLQHWRLTKYSWGVTWPRTSFLRFDGAWLDNPLSDVSPGDQMSHLDCTLVIWHLIMDKGKIKAHPWVSVQHLFEVSFEYRTLVCCGPFDLQLRPFPNNRTQMFNLWGSCKMIFSLKWWLLTILICNVLINCSAGRNITAFQFLPTIKLFTLSRWSRTQCLSPLNH